MDTLNLAASMTRLLLVGLVAALLPTSSRAEEDYLAMDGGLKKKLQLWEQAAGPQVARQIKALGAGTELESGTAAITLGRMGPRARGSITALIEALGDKREGLEWQLQGGSIGASTSIAKLARNALEGIGADAIEPAAYALVHESYQVRNNAALLLERATFDDSSAERRVVTIIINILRNGDDLARARVIESTTRGYYWNAKRQTATQKQLVDEYILVLDHSDPKLFRSLANGIIARKLQLGAVGKENIVKIPAWETARKKAILDRLEHQSAEMRLAALNALTYQLDQNSPEVKAAIVASSSRIDLCATGPFLPTFGGADLLRGLVQQLRSARGEMRETVACFMQYMIKENWAGVVDALSKEEESADVRVELEAIAAYLKGGRRSREEDYRVRQSRQASAAARNASGASR